MDCQRRCIAHPIHSLSWRRQLESPPQRSRSPPMWEELQTEVVELPETRHQEREHHP
ncbi:hypothetical protein QJS04_geneDACA010727 [Acorus gramineus]|uniref:Uncharacterized protein n=1 Tax=Acorus gramineus TaxID=55184 RepID=A0AAV9B7A0_ACOGR|nr:hypothetical protein QJS04_geneDACA010727 [Acorus gramineus]